MKRTHEEGDNIIFQQMVAATNEKGISMLSDETNKVVFLLYHYLAQML